MLECLKDKGDAQKSKSLETLAEGHRVSGGKTEYDSLEEKSPFDETSGVDDDLDYTTAKGPQDIEAYPLTNSVPSLIKVSKPRSP